MRFLLFFILTVAISACSVRQKIHFNDDFSGKVDIWIDMSQIVSSMPPDSNINLGPDSSFKASYGEIEKLKGITNVSVEEDNSTGLYHFSYEFEDIKALNRSLKGTELSNAKNKSEAIHFKKRFKKLTYTFPQLEDSSSAAQPNLVNSYLNFSVELSFSRTITSVKTKSKNVNCRDDGHHVFWNPEYTDLLKKGGNSIEIKLGK